MTLKIWLRGLALALTVPALPTTAFAETATKEKVDAALPRLEKIAQDLIAKGEVPSLAIGVVYKDEVVYLGGFGVREEGKPGEVDADTVFQIASSSKPISSTVVAALVSEGLVAWDSRISDLDPAFKLHDPYPTEQVTVTDLFAHRSGLSGNAGNDLEGLGFDRDTILHRVRFLNPTSSFRSAYAYSNFGLTEGAVAAAKPTGKSWEEVSEEKLYKPLGMSSTSSRHADFVKHSNRAELHAKLDGKWVALVKRNPDPQAPAGGVSSNVRDLAQWMRLELANGKYDGKQLIKEEAIAPTHVPVIERGKHPITGGYSFYGRGWNVEFGRYGLAWGHAGAFSQGARSVVCLLPDHDLGMVVLSNAFPTGVPDALCDIYFDLVFKGDVTDDWVTKWNAAYASMFEPALEAAEKTYGTPPESLKPALPDAAYVGTYANDYLGNAVVVAEGGELKLKLGPNGEKSFPLKHFDRDLFIYFPEAESPNMPYAVTFEIGPGQKASQVTIEDLNDDGQGVLTRAE
ncbi:MAG TPA: serine hydrolase [Methyloceanibacter sp.]|nr:serine hydrolase [Methyloceanibacter sp.]